MKYISTRDKSISVSAAEAIYLGISKDGGLFVPEFFPQLNKDILKHIASLDYIGRAVFILKLFLDDFTNAELHEYATKAYSRFDNVDNVCPLVKSEEGVYYLELFHGPTCAFKDFALTLLPYLLTASKKKLGITEKTLILTATSGDTGKAALEGFKDVENTDIIVFYPDQGVSKMQELQMRTQKGYNVSVFGVEGNFDDCQTAVKKIFCDESVKQRLLDKGYTMSSANSINWGRLLPQIVYYISSYCDLWNMDEIAEGQQINFVVPTGNFGDILAGYYAKKMGLPIDKLICASNSNNVLSDFFHTGVYSVKRKFHKTISPSMDILVSSNLERLIFELYDRNSEEVVKLYKELKESSEFTVPLKLIEEKIPYFLSGYATESETIATISYYYEEFDYLLDPHTAVGTEVYNEYLSETEDTTPTVLLSTAHPYKFALDVYNAVSTSKLEDSAKALKKLHFFTGVDMPDQLKYLFSLPVRFNVALTADEMEQAVFDYIDKRTKRYDD